MNILYYLQLGNDYVRDKMKKKKRARWLVKHAFCFFKKFCIKVCIWYRGSLAERRSYS